MGKLTVDCHPSLVAILSSLIELFGFLRTISLTSFSFLVYVKSWKLTKSSISHWSRDYEVWKGHLKRVEGTKQSNN